MDQLAIIAALEHQLSLLARAVRQPADSGAIHEGDLVQLAPDAHPDYGRYFLLVHCNAAGRVRGPLLTMHRSLWPNVPAGQVSRIGAAAWPTPALGFVAHPQTAALELEARNDAYRADVARKTALRKETLRRTAQQKAG